MKQSSTIIQNILNEVIWSQW